LSNSEMSAGRQTAAARVCREVELLLCCARTDIAPPELSQIRALVRESIDWELLRLLSLAQGVGPLLYGGLRRACPQGLPEGVLDELGRCVRASARRNLLLTGRLLRLLAALRSHGIRAIPFKGPLLAVQVYRDLTLRQFVDIDVLVHERDAASAKAVLMAHGYRQQMFHPWEASFEDDSGVSVDLHWRIAPSYDPTPHTFEQLWTRLVPVSLSGTEVLTLAPEDLLLILSIQLAKDSRESRQRLVQICDASELVRSHPGLDWQRVLTLARAAGGERILLLDLLLAHDLLDAPVPEAVLRQALGNRAVPALAQEVQARMFPASVAPGSLPAESGPASDHHLAFYVRTRERFVDKLRFLGLRARDRIGLVVRPSARDRAFLPLPASLDFLYYFVRPVRVLSGRVRARKIASEAGQGPAAPSRRW
jgi:hypothetical protein